MRGLADDNGYIIDMFHGNGDNDPPMISHYTMPIVFHTNDILSIMFHYCSLSIIAFHFIITRIQNITIIPEYKTH